MTIDFKQFFNSSEPFKTSMTLNFPFLIFERMTLIPDIEVKCQNNEVWGTFISTNMRNTKKLKGK